MLFPGLFNQLLAGIGFSPSCFWLQLFPGCGWLVLLAGEQAGNGHSNQRSGQPVALPANRGSSELPKPESSPSSLAALFTYDLVPLLLLEACLQVAQFLQVQPHLVCSSFLPSIPSGPPLPFQCPLGAKVRQQITCQPPWQEPAFSSTETSVWQASISATYGLSTLRPTAGP